MKTALEQHRQTWKGKSDEWLFERLNNELKSKVEEIHRLLNQSEQNVGGIQNGITAKLALNFMIITMIRTNITT